MGYPKTATKFLQFEIFPKLNLKYFFVGGTPKNEYKKMRRLLDDIRNPNANIIHPHYKHQLSQLIPKQTDTLISYESLSGEIYDPNILDMKVTSLRLNGLLDDTKIIVCTREKSSMLKSLYSQYIKEGGILEREDFNKYFFNMQRLDYDTYLDFLYKLFGKENVLHVDFELLKKDDHKFVSSICSFMNQPIPSFTNKKLNPGYSQKQIEIQRFLNNAFKTKLNPNGLPPQRLWEIINPAKKLVNNRISKKIIR